MIRPAIVLALVAWATPSAADWYLPAVPGTCISAAEYADQVGVPAFADPFKLYNYNQVVGVTVHLTKYVEPQDHAIIWGALVAWEGPPSWPYRLKTFRHMWFYASEKICLGAEQRAADATYNAARKAAERAGFTGH